jgi:hypothetical protein
VTNYYDKTVIVKNTLILSLKFTISVKNISDTKKLKIKAVLKFVTGAIRK